MKLAAVQLKSVKGNIEFNISRHIHAVNLAAGENADFIILNQDLMNIDEKDILKTNVLETWVDGAKTYYNQKYFDDLAKKLSGRAVSLDIIEAKAK